MGVLHHAADFLRQTALRVEGRIHAVSNAAVMIASAAEAACCAPYLTSAPRRLVR